MVYDRIINIYDEQDYFNNNYIPVFTFHFNQPRQQLEYLVYSKMSYIHANQS